MQTLWSADKLELLRKEMEVYNCDILGLSEMSWTGKGEMNGGEVIWSGEEKKEWASYKKCNALLSYNALNSVQHH